MFFSPLQFPDITISEEDVKDYDFVEIHVPEMRKNFPHKKCVLIHSLLNFDPVPDLQPYSWHNFFALKIEMSSRIRRTEENEKLLREFCDSIPIKKVLVPYAREWMDFEHDNVFVSKVICENLFLGYKWGDLPTVRKPKDLNLVPQKEYWIIFSGHEGKYYGEYPREILKRYKSYFESFDAKFYISWYIETPSIIKLGSENSVKKSIKEFKEITV